MAKRAAPATRRDEVVPLQDVIRGADGGHVPRRIPLRQDGDNLLPPHVGCCFRIVTIASTIGSAVACGL
jgi:hypothetical protein